MPVMRPGLCDPQQIAQVKPLSQLAPTKRVVNVSLLQILRNLL